MASTFREVCNRVLLTLREDQIDGAETSLSSDYHQLIGTFVNQIKEEIEDAHLWRDLQQTHTAQITTGNNSGSIVSANERSRLVYFNTEFGPRPVVFDVTDANNPIQLSEAPLALVAYNQLADPTTTSTNPVAFAIAADGAGGLTFHVFPKVTSTRNFTLRMVTPQDRLDVNDVDTVIKIPTRPLEMGAIWYALEERGEELGINSLFTEERFRKALDDAIARDAESQDIYQMNPV